MSCARWTVSCGSLLASTPSAIVSQANPIQAQPSVKQLTHITPQVVLYRKLRAPTKLSLGPELPTGTNICVDAHHINNSTVLWDRPDIFDGLRHYKARQSPQNENRFKFANLGSDAPGWGDGLQACPGRMFADNTIKIILAHLLMHYDLKLRPGEAKPKQGAMPNGSTMPDLGAKILFRSRRGAALDGKGV